MATPSKTAGTVLLSHQGITHPDTVKGSAWDVSTIFQVEVLLYHASVEATANTNPGSFLVQVSGAAAGDEDWITKVEITAGSGTADTEAMTATEPVAETVLAVASTTGFAAKDGLYVQDAGTLADSEWGYCQEIVANVSINLLDGLTNQKDSSDVIWNKAETWAISVDVGAVKRLRVAFVHEGATGANVHVKAHGNSLDSVA